MKLGSFSTASFQYCLASGIRRFSQAITPCSKRVRASGELVVMGMRSETGVAFDGCGVWAYELAAKINTGKKRKIKTDFLILLIPTQEIAVLNGQLALNFQNLYCLINAKNIDHSNGPGYCF